MAPARSGSGGRCSGRHALGQPRLQPVGSANVGVIVQKFGGTSVAVPFVTGAIALLRSEFPTLSAADVRLAIGGASRRQRSSVVPPLLNASAAYDALSARM